MRIPLAEGLILVRLLLLSRSLSGVCLFSVWESAFNQSSLRQCPSVTLMRTCLQHNLPLLSPVRLVGGVKGEIGTLLGSIRISKIIIIKLPDDCDCS